MGNSVPAARRLLCGRVAARFLFTVAMIYLGGLPFWWQRRLNGIAHVFVIACGAVSILSARGTPRPKGVLKDLVQILTVILGVAAVGIALFLAGKDTWQRVSANWPFRVVWLLFCMCAAIREHVWGFRQGAL